MAVSATYTKDIHYSGIITVDGETVVSMDANMDAKHPDVPIINRYINNGRKYRANKKDIDDVVDKFENDICMISTLQSWKKREKLSRAGNGPSSAFNSGKERQSSE
jgi:hypothetical protein